MNTYRIRYKTGHSGVRIVQADSVNGFKPENDSYVFKIDNEVVCVVPKESVVSITKIKGSEEVE